MTIKPSLFTILVMTAGLIPAVAMVANDQVVGRHASGLPVLAGDIQDEADLSNVTFEPGVDLSGAKFTCVKLTGACLAGTNLRNATFYRGSWQGVVDFSGADLTGARIEKIFINNLILDRADLTGADFRHSLIKKFSLDGAVWSGTVWLDGRTDHPLEPPALPDSPWESSGVPSAGSGQDAGYFRAGLGMPEFRSHALPPPGSFPQGPGAGASSHPGGAGHPGDGRAAFASAPKSQGIKRKAETLEAPGDSGEDQPPPKRVRLGRSRCDITWEGFLNRLIAFEKAEGHTQVTRSHDYGLAKWKFTQSWNYRNGVAAMTAERIAALEKIPTWQWDRLPNTDEEDNQSKWEMHLKALEAFAKAHKTTGMPRTHVEGGFKLGNWVYNQRSQKRRKSHLMTPERIKALEAVRYWQW